MTCLADISFRSEGTLCGLPPGPRRRLASQAKDVDCERCLRALAEIRAADPPKVSVERLRVILRTIMPDLRDFAALMLTKFHKAHLDCSNAMTWDQRFDRLMRHASTQDVAWAMQHDRRFVKLVETCVSSEGA